MSGLPKLEPAHLDAVFDVLFARSPLGVALVSRQQQLLRVNAAFARMLGYAPEELVGRTVSDVTHPEDLERSAEIIGRLVGRERDAMRSSKRYLARDGSTVWATVTVLLVDAGEVDGVAMVEDITERHRMEEALVRSNERFELLSTATNDLVYEWDVVTGTILWNAVLHTRYHYPESPEIRTLKFWEDRIHPEDRQRVLDDLARSLESSDELWSCEYRFWGEGPGWVSVLDRGLFMRDRDGQAFRMIGVMVDVTEMKRTQAQLRLADRLAAVGTLAAGVAHEINNPLAWTLNNLAVVRGVLDQWPDAGQSEAARRARVALSDAIDGAERVARIVRDVKTFARPDEEGRMEIDLVRVVDAALALAQNELRHRAKVVRDFQPVPAVFGNESRLGQVFLNLIVNAAQAVPEGAAERNEVRVSLRRTPDGRVEAVVADTGPGIPPEIAARVFEPFFTTKPGVGTGLGLSICHGIVTAHGGEIRVESRLGEGTRFRVLLPAAPAVEPAVHAQASETSPSATRRRARILVLDDEPNIGRALKRALDRHEVETATSGAAVLEQLRAGARWDLILCDVMMPEMSGMEFFAALDEACPECCGRVVFMTGGAFTPKAAAFFANLTNPRLEKPFDAGAVERLLDAVRTDTVRRG